MISVRWALRWTTSVAIAAALAACGGGGGSSSTSSISTISSSSSSGGTSSSSGGTATSYSVSANVSGLSGAGLLLELNAADDLAVAASGLVTFSNMLASGVAYGVTVKVQPAGQFCIVSSGSGVIGAANVTVAVGCSSTPVLSTGGSNIVTVTVGTGPAGTSANVNIPYVSVTVCAPGTTTCATVDHILLDTGSWGLRVFASVLQSASTPVSLPNEIDANSHPIAECVGFADGYTWGPVATADVRIGGESAGGVPVQVIDDNASTAVAGLAPGSCTTQGGGTDLNSVAAFGANGILGVGLFAQDCGNACVTSTHHIYYACNGSASSCLDTTLALTRQVTNPTSLFAIDNNGVVVQLPAIATTGAPTVTGYLGFGIGTQSNNFLGGATLLTADASGDLISTYKGKTLTRSFIDSGSNGLYFTDSAITACKPPSAAFYCPSSTLSLTATNQGQNGQTKPADFSVANLNALNGNYSAFNDIGGTLAGSSTLASNNTFDWGLPFFFGRTVYFALESQQVGGSASPYYAY